MCVEGEELGVPPEGVTLLFLSPEGVREYTHMEHPTTPGHMSRYFCRQFSPAAREVLGGEEAAARRLREICNIDACLSL